MYQEEPVSWMKRLNMITKSYEQLIDKTISTWVQVFDRRISKPEAEEIIRNLSGLINLLIELEGENASS